MKKIYIIIAFTLLHAVAVNAQTDYVPSGSWKYINGTDTIEMYFKTDQIILNGNAHPIIIGFHKYVKGGQLIESTIQLSNSGTYANHRYSIATYGIDTTKVQQGEIKDISLNYKRDIFFTKINPTTINVDLTSLERWQKNRPPNNAYTLPRHFTLIKQ
jgi:hypothetical protein